MTAAVALLIFNRPDTTQRVFDTIRAYRPERLFIIADGPRTPSEVGLCAVTRTITEQIDWPCHVERKYAETNLGTRHGIEAGLTWVFERTEEAIILEDDCLPDPSFFPYCEELLGRYQADKRVMMISGNNFQFGRSWTADSYYFSRNAHTWGWASWRRAWQHYDGAMEAWKSLRDTPWLSEILGSAQIATFWRTIFDDVAYGRMSTCWDYPWFFACLRQGGCVALPAANLVRNIGFGSGATHTVTATSPLANMAVRPMQFPLRHPAGIQPHMGADRAFFSRVYQQSTGQRMQQAVYRALTSAVGHLRR